MYSPTVDHMIEYTCLDCVTCGHRLIDCGATCSNCHTPLEVSRSVNMRGTPPRFVPVLGASGAGKTVYMGLMLDMLSKATHGIRGLPNGSYSVNLQQHTIAALESRRFPDKTPAEPDQWNWLHCEAFREKKPSHRIDLLTPDVAGEAVALELQQPRTVSIIRTIMGRSAAVMLLFDSQRVRDAGRDEDLFGMKLICSLTALHTSENNRRRRRPITLPVAIVLTKVDRCREALDDPQQFASVHLNGMMQLCQQRLANYRVFAASVVGATMRQIDEHGGVTQVPLHIEPHGVMEPLQWILDQIQ